MPKVKITFRFVLEDLWVGAFWARTTRCLYVCPLPTLCFKFDFNIEPIAQWRRSMQAHGFTQYEIGQLELSARIGSAMTPAPADYFHEKFEAMAEDGQSFAQMVLWCNAVLKPEDE